jgi:hypothetical protein
VPVEDDQLLAKEDVFEDEFRLAAGQVQGGVEDRWIAVRLCPAAKKVLDSLAKRTNVLSHAGEE